MNSGMKKTEGEIGQGLIMNTPGGDRWSLFEQ